MVTVSGLAACRGEGSTTLRWLDSRSLTGRSWPLVKDDGSPKMLAHFGSPIAARAAG